MELFKNIAINTLKEQGITVSDAELISCNGKKVFFNVSVRGGYTRLMAVDMVTYYCYELMA